MEQTSVNNIVLISINEIDRVLRNKKKFQTLLSKHNPYEIGIFCNSPEEIVNFVLGSHKQTSKQTIMGYLLESIAVKICEEKMEGFKSKEECTDLEWTKDNKKHYRGFKSSPNWANADQKSRVNNKMKELNNNEDFGTFKVLTSYGKTKKNKNNKGFTQLSGQDAWEEFTGDSDMYNKVMKGILENKKLISQVIENIYLSDIQTAIEWVKQNFTNNDKSINFIKINQFISSKNGNNN
jgi:hypothetical protein